MIEKMKIENMIAALDGSIGRLIVASMGNPEINEAKEMITSVSLSLGEWAQAMEEIEFDAEYGQKYTIEQIVDAITQAGDELICAIQYRDRAGVEDAIREYLNNIKI